MRRWLILAFVVLIPAMVMANDAKLAPELKQTAGNQTVSVIVQHKTVPGTVNKGAILMMGGTVGRDLTLIKGVTAQMPASSVAALSEDDSVAYISPDRPMHSHMNNATSSLFQYKMSLKNAGMLRMDDQRARSREVESERDRGVSPRQRRNPLSWRKPAAGLCLDGDGVAPTAVRAARPQGARSAAALPGEDDRAQPGASDALDCPLSSPGHGGSGELSAAPLCAALHAGRHRTAGRRRRGPRHAQRTGHTAHSAARIPAVRQAGV